MAGTDPLDGYDAVVYDLDGTLAELAVDWEHVRQDVGRTLSDHGADPDGLDLWSMLERSRQEPTLAEAVEATIAEHEREGARTSERLGCADILLSHPEPLPVGVCSLNCEDACHLALERHDLDHRVRAVVGRDSVATEKPDPEPLLATLRGLEVEPDRAVFVGDGRRDEVTAERAGTAFRYVEEWL
ncbi:HAD family hydrolase [Haloglomus salinum]|jgi:phosphoglycolate phosphatase|uniref:HAD family hydrolase n=1 Tax=Haloglomus salinum TaxID=2962673 RepID=UPI0020C94BE6|nr:HAD family hydrolase [Haloglomus salinum]